jgi:hypothetical protein
MVGELVSVSGKHFTGPGLRLTYLRTRTHDSQNSAAFYSSVPALKKETKARGIGQYQ